MEIKLAWSGPFGQPHNQCTVSFNKDEVIELISTSLRKGLFGSEEIPGGMDGLFAIAHAIESTKESCECECHEHHNGHGNSDTGDAED